MNITYILSHPLVARDYRRYGIKYMQELGVNLTVIDAFNLFFNESSRNTLETQTNEIDGVVIVASLKHLFSEFSGSRANMVIMTTPVDSVFYRIVRFLNNKNIPIATISAGAIPSPDKGRVNYYIKKIFTVRGCKVIFKRIDMILAQSSLASSKLYIDWFFYGGRASIQRAPQIMKLAKRVKSLHALDYDLYLTGDSKRVINGKYILFLDQYIPHHPDILLLKGENTASLKQITQYYNELNTFLTFLEELYQCEVVVAAHPRSDYVDKDRRHFGRRVIHKSTAALVRDTQLCVTFNSTAVNFAVIYQKPILLMHSQLIDKLVGISYGYKMSVKLSSELGQKLIRIDSDFSSDFVRPSVSSVHYHNYKKNYIKEEGTSETFFWNAVLKAVSE